MRLAPEKIELPEAILRLSITVGKKKIVWIIRFDVGDAPTVAMNRCLAVDVRSDCLRSEAGFLSEVLIQQGASGGVAGFAVSSQQVDGDPTLVHSEHDGFSPIDSAPQGYAAGYRKLRAAAHGSHASKPYLRTR
ncbi:MAG: hypothetical protein AB7U20_06055 [Planctomycetaceae bacterium]